MSGHEPTEPTARDVTAWAAWLPAVTVTVAVATMLHQLVFSGWAHSYDSAIYVRSLWGAAFGDLHNPMVDLHVLSIHSNFVLFLLAPFARVVHPALVLIATQAVALGVTVWLVADTFRRLASDAGRDLWVSIVAALFGAFAVTVGSPIVVNPFLFDIRPDLIAVPLLTYGLLRAHRRGGFDWRSVGVMCLALLVREEMMMVIVGALVLSPWSRPWRSELVVRGVGVVVALGWWCLYWFGFRQWIGDGSYEIAQEVGSAFLDGEHPIGAALRYKAEIVLVAAVGMGAMSALGWRWLGAAVPGLLFLLASSRMQELALNFHYVAFAAPGVIVAGCEGFRRALPGFSRADTRLPWVSAAAIVVCFSLSSALPAGGRFRTENFYVLLAAEDDPNDTRPTLAEGDELLKAHDLLSGVPDGAAVAAPHELAGPIANRRTILPIPTLLAGLEGQGQVPQGVAWVVLPARYWTTTGRFLADVHGFYVVDYIPDRLAVLARGARQSLAWRRVNAEERPAPCGEPLAWWPAAGFRLCGTNVRHDNLHVTLFRDRMPKPELEGRSLGVVIRVPETGDTFPAWVLSGLINPAQIPLGGSCVAESVVSLDAASIEIALVTLDGQLVPARIPTPDGPQDVDAAPVTNDR